jgi:hypothetical protein
VAAVLAVIFASAVSIDAAVAGALDRLRAQAADAASANASFFIFLLFST